jgi:phosphoenolpyruvate carboxykinase (GTP)
MRPFIGYNVGDYFAHWLSMKERSCKPENLPKIFLGNWFIQDDNKKFIWPGFSDNVRVLDWVLKQCNNEPSVTSNVNSSVTSTDTAIETPLGISPSITGINTEGLPEKTKNAMKRLLLVDEKLWIKEVSRMEVFLDSLSRLPATIKKEHESLKRRIQESAKKAP